MSITPTDIWDLIVQKKTNACAFCLDFKPHSCHECAKYVKYIYKNAPDRQIGNLLIKTIEEYFKNIKDKESGLFTWEDYEKD